VKIHRRSERERAEAAAVKAAQPKRKTKFKGKPAAWRTACPWEPLKRATIAHLTRSHAPVAAPGIVVSPSKADLEAAALLESRRAIRGSGVSQHEAVTATLGRAHVNAQPGLARREGDEPVEAPIED